MSPVSVSLPVRAGAPEASFVIDSGTGLTLLTRRFARTLGVRPSGATFAGSGGAGRASPRRSPECPSSRPASAPSATWPSPTSSVSRPTSRRPEGSSGCRSSSARPCSSTTVRRPCGSTLREPRPTGRRGRGAGPAAALRPVRRPLAPVGPLRERQGRLGSDSPTLHRRYMEELGLAPEAPGVRSDRDTDESELGYGRAVSGDHPRRTDRRRLPASVPGPARGRPGADRLPAGRGAPCRRQNQRLVTTFFRV